MSRKLYRYVLLICILIGLPFFIYQVRHIYVQNPFDRNLHLENPSFITADTADNMYVIDRSMKRIVKMSSSGDVLFLIEGGKRNRGSFFYAAELAVDPAGYLYVLNRVLDFDGAYVEKEEILRYNPGGKFERVIFSKAYDDGEKPLREGWLTALTCFEDGIFCFYKGPDAVELYHIPPGGGSVSAQRAFPMTNARVMLVDVKGLVDQGRYAYTTKKGEIYTIGSGGSPELAYSAPDPDSADGMSIPWRLNLDQGGNIYFTDLGQRMIYRLDITTGKMETLISTRGMNDAGVDGAFYQFVLGAGGSLFTLNNGSIIYLDKPGSVGLVSDSARHSPGAMFHRFAVWLLPLAWIMALAVFIRRIYIDAFKKNIPMTAVQIAFIIVAVVLSAGIVSDMLFKSFFNRYEDQVLDNLSQTAQLAPFIIDGDRIQRIDALEHYNNEDYNIAREQLFKVFNDNQDSWNAGQYGVLYKVEDNVVYALMFYDDSIGTYYPVDFDFKNSKYAPVYERGEVVTVKESDADGDWIYALGPIYNTRGEIVAMVEAGSDLFEFVEENKKLVRNMFLEVATILVILIFVLVELLILGAIVSGRRTGAKETTGGAPLLPDGDTGIVRPLGFIMFTGTFMSVSFIPVLMKGMYQPLFGLPESVVLGLPISAEMLFVALFSVLAGYMIDARGWKPVFLTGAAVLGAGMLLSGLTDNPMIFILARAIVGAGFGLAIIALQNFAMSAPTEEKRNQGLASLTSGVFSGMNVGVVVGAMLAERVGFANVFFVAFAVMIMAGLFAQNMIPNVFVSSREARRERISLVKVGKFFANLNILSFFILIFIPVSICGMFLMYFFPLFAEDAGISPSNIGRAFLLNGLCIIYLGPLLVKYTSKYLGNMKSVVAYTILVAAAMLLFAHQGTVLAAFLAIVLLGIADSFGIALLINYFVGLKATAELGQGKAMGYYSLVEYLGQMLGPIALGSVMVLGVERGVGLVGVSLCAALVLFILLSRKEGGLQPGEKKNMAA